MKTLRVLFVVLAIVVKAFRERRKTMTNPATPSGRQYSIEELRDLGVIPDPSRPAAPAANAANPVPASTPVDPEQEKRVKLAETIAVSDAYYDHIRDTCKDPAVFNEVVGKLYEVLQAHLDLGAPSPAAIDNAKAQARRDIESQKPSGSTRHGSSGSTESRKEKIASIKDRWLYGKKP